MCSISCAARPNTPLASNIRVGSRLPAHATTMGRMMLAFMPEVEIDKLYAGKELERFSEHTATTLAALHANAARDRSAGIAWSDAHFESGISSAAVPVFDFAGNAARRHQCVGTGERLRRARSDGPHRRGAARGRLRDFPPPGLDRRRCRARAPRPSRWSRPANE